MKDLSTPVISVIIKLCLWVVWGIIKGSVADPDLFHFGGSIELALIMKTFHKTDYLLERYIFNRKKKEYGIFSILGLIRSRIRYSTKRSRGSGSISKWNGSATLIIGPNIMILFYHAIRNTNNYTDQLSKKCPTRGGGGGGFFFCWKSGLIRRISGKISTWRSPNIFRWTKLLVTQYAYAKGEGGGGNPSFHIFYKGIREASIKGSFFSGQSTKASSPPPHPLLGLVDKRTTSIDFKKNIKNFFLPPPSYWTVH